MHKKTLSALFPVVIASALLQANCSVCPAADMGDGASLETPQTLSRADIQKRLQKLAASALPSALSSGATQNEPTSLPDRIEYTCPICGTKTQYKRPSTASRRTGQDQGWSWNPAANTHNSRLASQLENEDNAAVWSAGDMVANQIPACRKLAKEIRNDNLSVKLDETRFCQKCSPDSGQGSPHLVLVIHYAGEKEVRRLTHVKANELRLILEFISGKRIHAASDGSESPLKNSLARLEFLLGVKMPQ
jgi:hypothetical protein